MKQSSTPVTFEDFSEDEYLKEFFILRDLGQSTRNTYLIRLRKYCEFNQKNLTDLISEAEEDEDQNIRMRKRRINKRLIAFKEHLRENGQTFNTIKTSMATIKGFYHEFDIETPRIKIKDLEEKERTTTEDIVGKDHIKQSLKYTNIKYKALILMMSGSGMGLAEISHLKWENFLDAISEYLEPVGNEQFDIQYITEKLRKTRNLILTWNIRRYKTGHPYTTFTTPEANMALLDYLEERNNENKPIVKIDDPLFLSNNGAIKRSAVHKYFAYLNDTCKFGVKGKSRFFTSHKLRKYFASTLTSNRVPESYTRWFLGHNDSMTLDRYNKPNPKALKEEYIRLIPHLSIETVQVHEVTTEGFDKLVNQLEKERESRENLQAEKDEEIAGMKRKIDEIAAKNKERDEYVDEIMNNKRIQEELIKR
jgi:integrase